MQYAFLPVFLFILCALGLAVGLLIVARLFNPGHPGRVTRMPYENYEKVFNSFIRWARSVFSQHSS